MSTGFTISAYSPELLAIAVGLTILDGIGNDVIRYKSAEVIPEQSWLRHCGESIRDKGTFDEQGSCVSGGSDDSV